MKRFPPVTALLPHAPPMVLLDEVLEHEGDRMACSVTVREGAPFVRDGRVATVVTLEYMAQCIAAFAGLDALAFGDGPRIGFLIGCREMQLLRDAIPVGTALTIEVKRVWGDALLGHFDCRALADGHCVASAALSVYRGDRDGTASP